MARKGSAPPKDFDPAMLKPTTARQVLVRLLEQEPALKSVAADLAEQAADNPEMRDLVEEIETALNGVSAGDIFHNSGRRRESYKEPELVAPELLSNATHSYFERLGKLLRQGRDSQALILCEAIILAMYRYAHAELYEELNKYAADFPEESADWAACLWRSAGDDQSAAGRRFCLGRSIPSDFVELYVPEWHWLLDDT